MSLTMAFMGTPDFAVPSLAACIDKGHVIKVVYCQPPRPAGRGMALTPSPIHAFALARGIEVRTPLRLKAPEDQQAFADLNLDIAVVAAYGLILPAPVLAAPRLGCINVHGSLLPCWRGAAPIHRAILAGDHQTGISIMQMDQGLDTGPVLLTAGLDILPDTTTGMLHDQLAQLGAQLLVQALDGLEQGRLSAHPQVQEGVTYAAKITKDEARINWAQSAEQINRQIRAFAPVPGAFTTMSDGTRLKILEAEIVDAVGGEAGCLIDDGLLIACGIGGIRPQRLQREGRAVQDRDTFLRGQVMPAASRLG
jgi:methionyl-tRNA formyltransferase